MDSQMTDTHNTTSPEPDNDSSAPTSPTRPNFHKRRRAGSLSSPSLKRQELLTSDDLLDSDDVAVSSISVMQPSQWQATIERAVKAIVSIRFSQVAAFDTEGTEGGREGDS
ncbi:hypothetical protein BC937DRAFT_91874 [Endogone sp. FLAS-F59071]|nr:hypothetical protein BC937DRAFT_91874 [Endogone sp. FLAS-F59071]|eukprot:RUS15869.1 hypothetical protein BC937DRAFT_91874 [Endogone sp. FLAS-F59071]